MFWQTNNNDSDTYDIYRLYHLGIASQLEWIRVVQFVAWEHYVKP